MNHKLLQGAIATARAAHMKGPAGTTAYFISDENMQLLKKGLTESGVPWNEAEPRKLTKWIEQHATNDNQLRDALQTVIDELKEYGFIGKAGVPPTDADYHWSTSPSIIKAINVLNATK